MFEAKDRTAACVPKKKRSSPHPVATSTSAVCSDSISLSRRARYPQSERRVGVSESDGASQRTRSRSHGMAVIAALDNPLAVLLADDLTDMVTPDDDRANGRAAGIRSIMSP